MDKNPDWNVFLNISALLKLQWNQNQVKIVHPQHKHKLKKLIE